MLGVVESVIRDICCWQGAPEPQRKPIGNIKKLGVGIYRSVRAIYCVEIRCISAICMAIQKRQGFAAVADGPLLDLLTSQMMNGAAACVAQSSLEAKPAKPLLKLGNLQSQWERRGLRSSLT